MEDDADIWGEEPAWLRDDGDATITDPSPEGLDGWGGLGAQHMLILIDCRPSMFVPCIPLVKGNNTGKVDQEEDKISAFDAALMACEKVLRLRVHYVATSKAGKRDGVGIMLYGTKQRPGATTQDSEAEKQVEKMEEEDDDTDDEDEDMGVASTPMSSTHSLLPIAPPGVHEIRSVRNCLPDRDRGLPRQRNLKEEYADTSEQTEASHVAQRMGHVTLCPLRSALHEALKAFVSSTHVKKRSPTSKTPADVKTIWIFTNEDDPCGGNKEEERLVGITARDTVENGISLQVWPLPRADGVCFSRAKFYDNITTARADDTIDGDKVEDSAFDLDDMLDRVLRQWKKVRTVASLPMLLPDWRDNPGDPGIMVDLFAFVMIQRKPQAVSIHQYTNKKTEKTTQLVVEDTGEVIVDGRQKFASKSGTGTGEAPQDQGQDRIRTFASFADGRVPLTRGELALIKKQENATDHASLILLGFKPIDAVPLAHNMDRSLLVYPNDNKVKGSVAAFANLHSAMVDKQVLAIGELLQRATATSRLVALLPQQEEREVIDVSPERSIERQLTPPGLVLVHLPFEDDVRVVENDLGAAAPKETVTAAMNLVQSQKVEGIEFGYSFENAALSRFWNYIESVALDTPQKTEEDETKVDYEMIKQVAGQQIDTFRSLLPADEVAPTKNRKRKLGGDEDVNWLDLYKTNSLSDCTAALLQKYLVENDLKKTGKNKEELIERVSQHIEENLLVAMDE